MQGRDLEGIPEHAAANDEENGKHENGSNENKDDSDSSSSSSKASTPKESMFKVRVSDLIILITYKWKEASSFHENCGSDWNVTLNTFSLPI